MNTSRSIKLFTLASCFAVTGCFKEYSENFAEEETIVENAAIGQQLADDALDVVYQAEILQMANPGGSTTTGPWRTFCGTITDDQVNRLLTIDFGTECKDLNLSSHSGKILSTYAGALGDSLADRTVTFSGYSVNNNKVEGTISLHDHIILPDSAYIATRTLTDFKVTFASGTAILFNGSHVRVWSSGRADALRSNNVYSFTQGSLTGVSSAGRTFTQTITTPFTVNFYCASLGFFPRTYGVVELAELEGYPERKRTVDYGDSLKYDNTITVETFRRTYGVTPPK
jgi:hypothetical protein